MSSIHELEKAIQELEKQQRAGWYLNLYEKSGEASGSFISSIQPKNQSNFNPNPDSQRAEEEAARRARAKMRRYCTHNGLNRLGTLTFAPPGCYDPLEARILVAKFFKNLRLDVGPKFPYLWVTEWHKTHGLHVHFVVNKFIHKSSINRAWPQGHNFIKLLGDLPTGSNAHYEARTAAGYLAKYIGKDTDDKRRPKRLHRYEIAQGFTPIPTKIFAPTLSEVMSIAQSVMKREQSYFWSSNDQADWGATPAVFVQW